MSILVSLLLHDHYVVPSMRINEPEWEFLKRACLVIYEPPSPTASNIEEQLARCILLGNWCDYASPMSPVLRNNLEEIACKIYGKMLTNQQQAVCEIAAEWAEVIATPQAYTRDSITHNSVRKREQNFSLQIDMRPQGYMYNCTFMVIDHENPVDGDDNYAVVAVANPDNYLSCHGIKQEAEEMAEFVAKCFNGKVKK